LIVLFKLAKIIVTIKVFADKENVNASMDFKENRANKLLVQMIVINKVHAYLMVNANVILDSHSKIVPKEHVSMDVIKMVFAIWIQVSAYVIKVTLAKPVRIKCVFMIVEAKVNVIKREDVNVILGIVEILANGKHAKIIAMVKEFAMTVNAFVKKDIMDSIVKHMILLLIILNVTKIALKNVLKNVRVKLWNALEHVKEHV
jgi:hypothetical protein